MEERMTLCNMSIEGGARVGYVNPDSTTFDYLRGREFAPQGEAFERAVAWWQSIASDADARYGDRVSLDGGAIAPMVTWGINPGQAIGVDEKMPRLQDLSDDDRGVAEEAFAHMDLRPGDPIEGTPIDVAFIGSCTNGSYDDLLQAALVVLGARDAGYTKAASDFVVFPGSGGVKQRIEQPDPRLDGESIADVLRSVGAQIRDSWCGPCFGQGPDALTDGQTAITSFNRNWQNRMGRGGLGFLASPPVVASSALLGYMAPPSDLGLPWDPERFGV